MENVGMLVHRGLREVLGSLAEIGYNAEWQDIRASDMGAPHRRERIWIVAYPGRKHGSERDTAGMEADQRQRAYSELHAESGCAGQLSDSDNQGLERRQITGKIAGSGAERNKQPQRQSKQPGENYWSTEPGMGRLAHGVPGRVDRLKGLGNAIVPQIAELIFNQIKVQL